MTRSLFRKNHHNSPAHSGGPSFCLFCRHRLGEGEHCSVMQQENITLWFCPLTSAAPHLISNFSVRFEPNLKSPVAAKRSRFRDFFPIGTNVQEKSRKRPDLPLKSRSLLKIENQSPKSHQRIRMSHQKCHYISEKRNSPTVVVEYFLSIAQF